MRWLASYRNDNKFKLRRLKMTDYEKAVWLLAAMARIHRPAVYLEVDDILGKCSSKELDRFYIWWRCGGESNV